MDTETNASLNIYKKSLEVLPMPVLLVGADEHIVFMNDSYGKFLGIDPKTAIGKHVCEVIENSRTPIVLKTQKAEFADRHKYVNGKVKGQEIIVHRIPIVENGKSIGVFGLLLFTSIEDLMALAEKNRKINDELSYYKNQLRSLQNSKYSLDNLTGSSARMQQLKNDIVKVASVKQTVLIVGESGVGKELIAHSVHNCSPRHDQVFVRMNCAAIPENLFESEFFGYEAGSFSGASKGGKVGKFELASGGTLFLDEIGELPLFMQSKLLRVLQEREVTRIGGNKTIPVDVRIVAATNRDLEKMVREGTFRQDLYYRLNILTIKAPPLREHLEDIGELVVSIMEDIFKENGVKKSIQHEVCQVFKQYPWPGNVRELSNVLAKMYYMSNGDMITVNDIPKFIRQGSENIVLREDAEGLDAMLEDIQRQAVVDTLKKNHKNLTKTAEILKISRPRLYRILATIPKEILDDIE